MGYKDLRFGQLLIHASWFEFPVMGFKEGKKSREKENMEKY